MWDFFCLAIVFLRKMGRLFFESPPFGAEELPRRAARQGHRGVLRASLRLPAAHHRTGCSQLASFVADSNPSTRSIFQRSTTGKRSIVKEHRLQASIKLAATGAILRPRPGQDEGVTANLYVGAAPP